MPSPPLLAAEGCNSDKEQASTDVAIEVTYSLPPTVELHPASVFTTAKKKQSVVHLGQ